MEEFLRLHVHDKTGAHAFPSFVRVIMFVCLR
jgi:hypothetical protein